MPYKIPERDLNVISELSKLPFGPLIHVIDLYIASFVAYTSLSSCLDLKLTFTMNTITVINVIAVLKYEI